MFRVCPSCKWNPCECSAKWTEPIPAWEMFRKYRPQKLIAAGAIMYGGRAYVVETGDPAKGTVDVVYGFDLLPTGLFRCEEIGKRQFHAYDRQLPTATKLVDVYAVS